MNKLPVAMIATLIGGIAAGVALAQRPVDPVTAEVALAADMADAARKLIARLTPAQRTRTVLEFGTDDRLRWHYVPKRRSGIALKELDDGQRALVHGLLGVLRSKPGLAKVNGIIALEDVLRKREDNPGRDPGLYYLAIFGEPSTTASWGLRFEGHHLSLNLTVVGGVKLVSAPEFLGANPSPVTGSRVLGREEDLAFQLVASLDDGQRKTAVDQTTAPSDILTGPGERLTDLPGLPASRMTPAQRKLLDAIVEEVTGNLPRPLAERERARIAAHPAGELVFTWAGATSPGKGHYVRIAGPSFLYELDNTQGSATHIHTVWHAREPAGGDFGVDLLRQHYQQSHGAGERR